MTLQIDRYFLEAEQFYLAMNDKELSEQTAKKIFRLRRKQKRA
jgi:hypothetical protein